MLTHGEIQAVVDRVNQDRWHTSPHLAPTLLHLPLPPDPCTCPWPGVRSWAGWRGCRR